MKKTSYEELFENTNTNIGKREDREEQESKSYIESEKGSEEDFLDILFKKKKT